MVQTLKEAKEGQWFLPSQRLLFGKNATVMAIEGSQVRLRFDLATEDSWWQIADVTPQEKSGARTVFLNVYDCDRYFVHHNRIHPAVAGSGDSNLWNGVRATAGACKGKVAYGVQVISGKLLRVGWGLADASLTLGTDNMSWGYGATGKKSHNNEYLIYGEAYNPGDVVVCGADLDIGTISFAVNGITQGVAYRVFEEYPGLRGQIFLPQLCVKDATTTVFFSVTPDAPSGLTLEGMRGHSWLADSPHQENSPYNAFNPLPLKGMGAAGANRTRPLPPPSSFPSQQARDESEPSNDNDAALKSTTQSAYSNNSSRPSERPPEQRSSQFPSSVPSGSPSPSAPTSSAPEMPRFGGAPRATSSKAKAKPKPKPQEEKGTANAPVTDSYSAGWDSD
eukprot:NODE_950_length_1357_cov_15.409021_g791_i0.p1 GENE.NODE_950_length_1357_cov_15.409021_g791_i0~~NODE_950_length_1357_cov_15.409021_g791_i0.p1  ORF type:complete len:449 (-),score=116.14 NODE_950_length_1357_cov_15.409021_g791_i0:9-1187(-)